MANILLILLILRLGEAEVWMALWRSTRPSITNTNKWCPFHHRGLEYKSEKKSKDSCSNRQIWTWNTKWSRAKTNRVLTRMFALVFALVIANTLFQQHKRPSTHGPHQTVNTEIRLTTFLAAEDEEAVYNQQNGTQSWLWLRSWTFYCKTQT